MSPLGLSLSYNRFILGVRHTGAEERMDGTLHVSICARNEASYFNGSHRLRSADTGLRTQNGCKETLIVPRLTDD